MTRDESKIKWTLYILIYIYIEIRNKQVTPAKDLLGYHKRPPVKWKPLTSPYVWAGETGCPSQQALQETPTNPWAGLPIRPGRCARFYLPTGPAGHSDHPLGRTPHPPRAVRPVVHPRRPCRKLRPPPGLDSPSPQAGVPGSTPPQALQDAPTTPWAGLPIPPGQLANCPSLQPLQETLTTPSAGLPIPPGRCARFYVPTVPAGGSDHPLGRTPHPTRPVGPVVHPRRPCGKLRPPAWLDSPSPQAGVPRSTPPQALQDAPTTPWAGLPVRPGRCARLSIPAGPARNSDHPLGWTPHPPRPVCPVLRPHRPCRTLQPPPGQDSPSPQASWPIVHPCSPCRKL